MAHVPAQLAPAATVSSLLPMDSKLQDAIRWVNDHRRAHPELSMKSLVEDAARRFDLPIADQGELRRLFPSK